MNRHRMLLTLGLGLVTSGFAMPADATEPRRVAGFDRVVIDSAMPGGYQVEVADVNGDGKLDIVGVGGGVCAWYENPGWTKRIVSDARSTPGIISSATADLDGDGKAEIAIAYRFTQTKPYEGTLALATQGEGGWSLAKIAEIGSIHRLRFGDLDGDRRPELVVAPFVGPTATAPMFDQSPARLAVFRLGDKPRDVRAWTMTELAERPILHAIKVLDVDNDGRAEVLTADNFGVALVTLDGPQVRTRSLSRGLEASAPRRGSSEVHLGRLADGRRFLATIEPWHGRSVVVRLEETPGSLRFGPRVEIDDTLADGHALWVADVDGDGDDELFAGHRGADHRVSVYDFDGTHWDRTVIDREVAAQDLRGDDLDGDGAPDVVAIGGVTKNVIWYKPRRPSEK